MIQAKEELWEYAIPPLNEAFTTLVVSLDGAYVLMRDAGYVVNYWTFFTSLSIWQTSLTPPIQEKQINPSAQFG
jgi:hypothetical protein